jgi:hypothetical protein
MHEPETMTSALHCDGRYTILGQLAKTGQGNGIARPNYSVCRIPFCSQRWKSYIHAIASWSRSA